MFDVDLYQHILGLSDPWVALMISRKLDNVISYCRHPITNVVAEGCRNIENFKTVTYFHCGGLRLYP